MERVYRHGDPPLSRAISARALRAFFSPDCDENVITLLKIYGANIATPIYLADGYTKRLDALTTDDDIAYGVTSEGIDHIFLPFSISLPSDEASSGLRCQLTIHNATRYITPLIRSLDGPPSVRIQLVLQGASSASNGTDVSSPELSIDGLELNGIGYDSDSVTGVLTVESYASEPFPCHTMTPSTFPGLF